MLKRVVDLVISALALVILFPLFLVVALLIKLDSPGPVFFRGVRVGRYGRPFRIYKFRTMVADADKIGGPSTAADDPRITRVGKWIRRFNLDELPQFITVLKGEMSIVGPRPEVPQYVEKFTEEEKAILSVRPGITDWATLWIRDEGKILAGSEDPERTYMEKIWPEKHRLALEYVRNHSLWIDLQIMFKTVKVHLFDRFTSSGQSAREAREDKEANRMGFESHPVGAESVAAIPKALLQSMYVSMVRIRRFEERAADLVEAGEIKTPCHLYIGQEGIAAGVCAALEREDYVWGGHRSHGHYLAKGGDLRAMMAELYGKATGCSGGRGGSMHVVAPEVGIMGTVPLVAATIPLAVGAGLAAKLRGDRRISVAFFGDGAVEEGHFHESVNLAALYRLPVLFVCENNFYSSHMHLLERRVEDNICKAAEVHGIAGIRLDGNDVVAVYQATQEAVARAGRGEGPTLLECRTYRWCGHVGPGRDMDVGVKRKDELKEWLPRDPIARARACLTEAGMPEEEFAQIEHEIRAEVDEAVLFARQSPYPDKSELLEHVFQSEKEVS